MSTQLLIAALVQGSLYALIALGLNLIYGTMRLLNVAHGEFVMIGAYIAYWGITLLGLSPIIAIFLAIPFTVALGAAFYFGIFKRAMRSREFVERIEANSLLVFFGASIIIQNVTALLFTPDQRAYHYLEQIVHIGPAQTPISKLVALAIAGAVCIGAVAFFRLSTLGIAIKALIQQREASALVGIPVARIDMICFCLGFAVAGLAGVLVSMTEQISPYMGFPFTVIAFVVVILGGLGNMLGSLFGGLLLGVLETFGVALTAPSYRSIMIYAVFIAVLLLRPQGLFGTKRART
ncbi:MAG TPA: branched-chain amino acid ABC transporter permease [Magnetospirillaceae bacterium]|jgi:branched-chain amino acid transport system permease protein